MKFIIVSRIGLFFMLFITSGCSNFLNISPPIDQTTSDRVFKDESTAIAAVRGIYSKILSNSWQVLNGGTTLVCGLSSRELVINTTSLSYEPFFKRELTPTLSPIANLWNVLYSYIYQANDVIYKLEKADSFSPALRDELIGECKFLRSLAYFYLLNLFGNVPLATTPDFRINATLKQRTSEQIWKFLEEDLIDAKRLMKSEFPSEQRFRAGKIAVSALLARIYLYQSKWQKAFDEATLVINHPDVHLESIDRLFLVNSKEAILHLKQSSKEGRNTEEGYQFIPTMNIIPPFGISNELLNEFESFDKRKEKWVGSTIVNGLRYTYPFKYKVKTGTVITECYSILRLAEILLIRAEAATYLENIENAISDIDLIRGRAGVSLLQDIEEPVDKAMLLKMVAHERRVELFAEWGHNWFDQIRKGLVSGPKILFPIPNNEILSNPNLIQNDGY